MSSAGVTDAKQCPWCERYALKDDACNWVCCGLTESGFHLHQGCGMQWCFGCGKKLCGQLFDPHTGAHCPGVATHHTATCCGVGPTICPGGHNSHK